MMNKDIKKRTQMESRHMTEADWIMLVALFLSIWILMVLRYMNI